MSDNTITLEIDGQGIATLSINRPEIHNAFDDALIHELTQTLVRIDQDPEIRVVILKSAGKSFSAGADLRWMRRMAGYTPAENKADSLKLAELMSTLNTLSKPTIARVQGAAFGGGVGLVACCDIAIASDKALFCLSEVRLGLIPAVISPYVVAAIGERAARRYFLTAERFSAHQAEHLNLVHEVVEQDSLDATIDTLCQRLLDAGPAAISAAKDLIFSVSRQPTHAAIIDDTAQRITDTRASDEGQEGLSAFLEKRAPNWIRS